MARFEPMPAEMYELRAALRGDQIATTRFFMARQGMIPREAFFNRENLERLLGRPVSPEQWRLGPACGAGSGGGGGERIHNCEESTRDRRGDGYSGGTPWTASQSSRYLSRTDASNSSANDRGMPRMRLTS